MQGSVVWGSSVDVGTALLSMVCTFASVVFYQLLKRRLVIKTDANCTLQKPTQSNLVSNHQHLLRIPMSQLTNICCLRYLKSNDFSGRRFLQKTNEPILLYYYEILGRLVFVCSLEKVEDNKKTFRN